MASCLTEVRISPERVNSHPKGPPGVHASQVGRKKKRTDTQANGPADHTGGIEKVCGRWE